MLVQKSCYLVMMMMMMMMLNMDDAFASSCWPKRDGAVLPACLLASTTFTSPCKRSSASTEMSLSLLSDSRPSSQRLINLTRAACSGGSKRHYVARKLKSEDPLHPSISPNAIYYTLEDRSTLIVRPPPSIAPPGIAYPIPGGSSATLATAHHHQSHPLAAPSSPAASRMPIDLPPLATPRPRQPSRHLSEEELDKMREMRTSDPLTWSQSKLAKHFGVSKGVIAVEGFKSKTPLAKEQAKLVKSVHQKMHDLRQSHLGWRKRSIEEERRRRKDLW
ncbi:uncharacterized protein L969DRAFT_84110 [Mixia osmundae IAM 14324]|uniref:uncharacterized protein n=1 Tax=Mixia osmundae (strain CBS 9802 / IAM 14324 / JCM 22182 / KY 12970) TaxID=764103 RepID=UPI0004A55469|nr:uncharacterized protein L969DRAFT_84110 [Mixia osmundae IAM 14324]KEI42253.1 hypothetical protein L969DRAFT_84110 [Mixia osmundae IAM 14324]